MSMFFEVVRYRQDSRSDVTPRVTLTTNTWDDYGFKTSFSAVLHKADGSTAKFGGLKILRRGSETTDLKSSFSQLDDDCCSLGASAEYYRVLGGLHPQTARVILEALRDVAFDQRLFEAFKSEQGFETSLLRFQEARDALEEGAKIFRGVDPPTREELAFRFTCLVAGFREPHTLDLRFSRKRTLGRMMVLIGANGTGKTSVLGRLAYGLLGLLDRHRCETLLPAPALPGGVLALSWSAFDRFEIPRGALPTRYKYCGLRVFESPGEHGVGQGERTLQRGRARYERLDLDHSLQQATEMLNELGEDERQALADRFVAMHLGDEALCRELANANDEATFAAAVHRLSAGQKLVACTLIHLRARLAPGTMVLFDEPEAHLHPGLLSSLIRELNELLEQRDSFAVVATHSPLVLQETPAQQVIVLETANGVPLAREYPGETFGETMSFLMDRVFRVGGEQRNWRTIVDAHRHDGKLRELKAALRAELNLPLAGLLDEETDGDEA